jgi:hypothetical protein
MKKFVKYFLITIVLLFSISYAIVIYNFKPISEETKSYINANFSYKEIFFFSTVGFGKENGTDLLIHRFIVDTITFKIIGHPTNDQKRFLLKSIDTINSVLIHNRLVYSLDTNAKTSITIRFWNDFEMKSHFPDRHWSMARGYILSKKVNGSVLEEMEVVIIIDKPSITKLKSTIIQEITQVLGIFNDSEFEPKTVFSDYNQDTSFGPMDLACVKILYNSGLQPGVMQYTFEDALGITDERSIKEQTKSKKSIFEFN